MTVTHYTTLGVGATFEPEELQAAYLKLARVHHPDRAGGSHARMAEINVARDTLANPQAHRRYRRELRSTLPEECPVCAGQGYISRQRGFKHRIRSLCLGCAGAGLVSLPRSK